MDGLIIKKEWLDLILNGKKTMEIRGNVPRKHIGKRIALIESKSCFIRGECFLYGVDRLWLDNWFERDQKFHQIPMPRKGLIKYKKPYAWWLSRVKKYNKPIPYVRKKGQVIWVKNVIEKG